MIGPHLKSTLFPYTTLFRSFDAAPAEGADQAAEVVDQELRAYDLRRAPDRPDDRREAPGDRKSTRLNSSHITTSYAAFRLKKKNNNGSARVDHYKPSCARIL